MTGPPRIVGIAPKGETCDVCGKPAGYAVRGYDDPKIECVCSEHIPHDKAKWGRS